MVTIKVSFKNGCVSGKAKFKRRLYYINLPFGSLNNIHFDSYDFATPIVKEDDLSWIDELEFFDMMDE